MLFSSFSGKNLTIPAAFSLAGAELGIGEANLASREDVATLVVPLAKSGPVSIDRLRTFAASQFLTSA